MLPPLAPPVSDLPSSPLQLIVPLKKMIDQQLNTSRN
jgi:hypothetical protein